MRVSREQAAVNRERVLDTAAQLFRERGFHRVGVADLMKAAGLTHGAFYGQFESKEDLMAQACARAYETLQAHWQQASQKPADKALAEVVNTYLSPNHRDGPGQGCVMAALGAEAAREGPALRQTITEGTKAQLETLTALMPGDSKAERRQRAAAALAGMVGALIMARALDDASLSKEMLRATKAALLPG